MNKPINETIKEIQKASKISEEVYMIELEYQLKNAYIQGRIDVLKEVIDDTIKRK